MSDKRQRVDMPSGDRFIHTLCEIIDHREIFEKTYCGDRGWDRKNLTNKQWLELIAQPGWKNPVSTRQAD